MKKVYIVFLLGGLLSLSSCATYYTQNEKFQKAIESGDYKKAQDIANTKKVKNKDKLLGFLQKGTVSFLLEEYEESNRNFASADSVLELHINKTLEQTLALLSNEAIKTYAGEDFEKVYVNYYKALNYIGLNDYSAALVEVRKINEKLYRLNDKYSSHKNRFRDDAFAHVVMGLIYQANKEYNDAFIAFRNALNVYEKIYVPNFNFVIPLSFKQILLQSAYQAGFYDDMRFYEKKFGITFNDRSINAENGHVVFIWQNGLVPVKDEVSFNFVRVGNDGGMANFYSKEMNLTIPIFLPSNSDPNSFSSISSLRVAIPTYVERKSFYKSASLITDNASVTFQKSEDINAIAFKTLEDRLAREMGITLARIATKKTAEYAAREGNENVGALIGIINAFTEKADTRSWQSLPHSICFEKLSLPQGNQNITFEATSIYGAKMTQTYNVNIEAGKTKFIVINTPQTQPR